MRAEHEVAKTDIRKGEEAIFRFIDFWKRQHGKAPPHLVFDSKLTTYTLDRLDAEGITFITPRRRSPKLLAEAANLPASAWRTVELDIPHRKYRAPQTARPLGHAYRSSSSPISATTSPPSCSPTRHARPSKISSPAMPSACSSRMRSPTPCASFTSSSSVGFKIDFDMALLVLASGLYRLMARPVAFPIGKTPLVNLRPVDNPPDCDPV
jgi:hypothetical protein